VGYDIAGKRVFITGASSGIGAGLARGFAQRGGIVGICARREAELAAVLAECRKASPRSRMWVADLARLDSLDALAARVWDELGGVDVLVHNAGIPKRRVVTDLTPAVVEQVMAINYFSPIRLTLAFLPRMLAAKQGRIVHISSVAARLGPPQEAAYSASKAALSAFAEGMAMDLCDTPIKCYVVNPAIIDTPLFEMPDNEAPISDEVQPLPVEAMTEAILKQLDEDRFEVYVPESFAHYAAQRAKDVGGAMEGAKVWLRGKLAARKGRA
jgi:NAD(P)-dependent dehydrogenase (short-subunit alcohol dehydrogenase family)